MDVSSIDVSIKETDGEIPRPVAINYIPYKEVATVIIDQQNEKIKISYSMMSKDNKDFTIPDSLVSKILGVEKISSIIYTNTETCAPGVTSATCIMINIPLKKIDTTGFKDMQKAAREIGDLIIDDINQALDTYAEYHSVTVQTSGDITGAEDPVFNVVYTMHHLSSKLLFNMLILQNISEEIRFAGGFLNNVKELTKNENSVFTFSITPEEKRLLYSLHISAVSSGVIGHNNLSPLDILVEDELNRSKLFTDGFYPLNSIIHIIILSEEELQVNRTNSEIICSIF